MSKRIDVNEVLREIDGGPLKRQDVDGKGETIETDVTLKSILVNALLHHRNEDEKTSGEQKLSRFNLAQAIQGTDGEMDIAENDVGLLKKLVNNVYTSLVVGQVFHLLDGKEEKGE